MKKGGFTLLELLVVITIIALLAAILFPVFGLAKAKAKQTLCLSNLSQIGKAINLYMADYDDMFPAGDDASDKYAPSIWSGQPQWQAKISSLPLLTDILQPYVKSPEMFHCPMDDGTQIVDDFFPPIALPASPSLFAAYGSSYFYRTEIAFRSLSGTALQTPTKINLLLDGGGQWHGGARAVDATDDIETFFALESQYRYNVLFGDFHAKNVDRGTLTQIWSTPL